MDLCAAAAIAQHRMILTGLVIFGTHSGQLWWWCRWRWRRHGHRGGAATATAEAAAAAEAAAVAAPCACSTRLPSSRASFLFESKCHTFTMISIDFKIPGRPGILAGIVSFPGITCQTPEFRRPKKTKFSVSGMTPQTNGSVENGKYPFPVSKIAIRSGLRPLED